MRRRVTAFALLLSAATALPLAATPVQAASKPVPVATGRQLPWGLAPLPDGSALFTERDTRRIFSVRPGQAARHIYTVTEAVPGGEGGLLGIAVSPGYARDQLVYLYYTTGRDNRIAVIRRGSGARPRPIITGIPRGPRHNGGRLAFSPTGFLFAGTGDANNTSYSQNVRSLGGKVLKVHPNGSAAPGNRYGRVFSLGHRNVQGIAFDSARRPWATEFGQNTYDEVNLLVAGGNYGWPVVEGNVADSRYLRPKWTWRPPEASPSGLAFAGGSLYAAALRGERLWRLPLSGTRITGATPMYQGTYGRLRAVQVSPRDRSLWLTTSNGTNDRVLRIATFP